MKKFLIFLLVVIRLLIVGRIMFLLYKTSIDPTNYPMDTLTWWVYYLIFDIWMVTTFKTRENLDQD